MDAKNMTQAECEADIRARIAAGKLSAEVDVNWLAGQYEITDCRQYRLPAERELENRVCVQGALERATGRSIDREFLRAEHRHIQDGREAACRKYGEIGVEAFDREAENRNA